MSALLFQAANGRARCGLKGPRAAEWLLGQSVALPMTPNTWAYSDAAAGELLVARLGTAEFFLEEGARAERLTGEAEHDERVRGEGMGSIRVRALAVRGEEPRAERVSGERVRGPVVPGNAAPGEGVQHLKSALAANPPGVYPVLREDSAFELSGAGVHDALAQVCNIDFAHLSLASQPVIMTLMIGVAVLVLPQDAGGERRYRIWCDPTYGETFGATLGRVVVECGGTVRGVHP